MHRFWPPPLSPHCRSSKILGLERVLTFTLLPSWVSHSWFFSSMLPMNSGGYSNGYSHHPTTEKPHRQRRGGRRPRDGRDGGAGGGGWARASEPERRPCTDFDKAYFQSYSHVGIHEEMIKVLVVFTMGFCFCGSFSFSEFGGGFSVVLFSGLVCFSVFSAFTALWDIIFSSSLKMGLRTNLWVPRICSEICFGFHFMP